MSKFLNSFSWKGNLARDPNGLSQQAMAWIGKNFYVSEGCLGGVSITNPGTVWWKPPNCSRTAEFHPRRGMSMPVSSFRSGSPLRVGSPKRGRCAESSGAFRFPQPVILEALAVSTIPDGQIVSELQAIRDNYNLGRRFNAVEFDSMARRLGHMHRAHGTVQGVSTVLDRAGVCPLW